MIISFDTESPVGYTPSGVLGLTCLTYSTEDDPHSSSIVRGDDAVKLWLSWVRDPNITLLAHSAAHDMTVMSQAANPGADPGSGWAYELVWQAYDDERIICTYIRQRLLDIAAGNGYLPAGLGPLVKRFELGDIQEKSPSKIVKAYLKTREPCTTWPPEVLDAAPWRVKYGTLQDVPFDLWPADALEYALHDPLFTWRVHEQQPAGVLVNEREQTRAAFDLEILSKHGWVTDRPRVKRLLHLYGGVMGQTYQAMIETGLVSERLVWPVDDTRHRVDRSLSTKAIQALVWDVLGEEAPLTAKAQEVAGEYTGDLEWYSTHIGTDADTCTRAVATMGAKPITIVDTVEHFEAGDLRSWLRESGSEAINARRMYMKARHAVTHWISWLETTRRVRTHYNPLLNTGRVSCSPNIQNFPRDTDKPSDLAVRGCIVPDEGWPFVVADYSQLELCTLAQALTDLMRWKHGNPDYLSTMAVAINGGMDCHVMVAANMLGATYDEISSIHKVAKPKDPHERTRDETEVEDARQVSKIGNYGYWGGMGAKTFITHAAKQGVLLSLTQSTRVKDAVFGTWYESGDYFGYISDQCKKSHDNKCSVKLPRSGRVRGGCYYTQAANYLFQGPAADGCKVAAKRINVACYRDKTSALYGSRSVAFIHDEFICASRAARAQAALAEMERIMCESMRTVTPDVQIKTDGRILTERWSK